MLVEEQIRESFNYFSNFTICKYSNYELHNKYLFFTMVIVDFLPGIEIIARLASLQFPQLF